MRKQLWKLLVVVTLVVAAFFRIAPGYIEGSMNQIDGQPLIAVSPEAEALHRSLHIVDLHSEIGRAHV